MSLTDAINYELSIFEVQIVASFITFIWFEVLNLGFKIKKKLYKKYWRFIKPWDCRFCTSFWLGSSFIFYFIFTERYTEAVIYFFLNVLISSYYDKSYSNGSRPS